MIIFGCYDNCYSSNNTQYMYMYDKLNKDLSVLADWFKSNKYNATRHGYVPFIHNYRIT